MLPLLFFEFLWKFVWLLGWGIPSFLSPQELSPEVEETLISVLTGVVLVPLVMPWGYVFKQYVKAPGDRWGKQVTASAPKQSSSSPSSSASIVN
jgi:peptidoglycan/LPS O-acetylase OafA/YrhL